MRNKLKTIIALPLLALAFLIFTILNNQLFSGLRLDLTENNLYTLSEGSIDIVSSIEEPITFHFFFSENPSRDLTGLRAYAKQVQDLLSEYELASGGKLKLEIIDPVPFSEEEDQAASFGLQGVPINGAGDVLYFGLAGTDALGKSLVIPFFQTDKEAFLEYEISKMLQSLVQEDKPKLGLMSSLQIRSDMNMQTFQPTPAWTVIEQIELMFDLQNIDLSATEIPSEIDLLVLVHPKDLSDQTLYAIDQFVLSGGRLLAFVDPLPERDRAASANPMMPAPEPQPSDLNKLLASWGVSLRQGFVLADAQNALSVSGGPSGQPVRHLAIVGMGAENFSKHDMTVSALESINFATAGILDVDLVGREGLLVTPLIQSSNYAQAMATSRLQYLSDPADLQADFKPSGEIYNLALRIAGKASSAFPGGIESADARPTKDKAHIESSDDLNVIVVADTDILTDELWVQVQNFFGQRIANPWANNGDFVSNMVENLSGSSALIAVRSRGQFSRPFVVVQELRREAEARFLESADLLKAQLAETEQQLLALESSKTEQGAVSLSAEQEAALLSFQEEKLRIRKQLRHVRHQLDKDIEGLGTTLKFLNIALVPILLTLMLLMFNYIKASNRLRDDR